MEMVLMKKIFKVLVLIFMVTLLTGCGKKRAENMEQITTRLENLGYNVSEIHIEVPDKNISMIKIANNNLYQFEFIKFNSDENAKKVFQNDVDLFKKVNKKGKLKEKNDFDKFTQELSDTYNVVVRNKNIVVYISVNIEHKKDVNKALKELKF